MSEKIRDSFIFYRSFYHSAKKLPKEDKAEIFDAICSYALDGESVEMSIVPEAIFTVIKPQLDANRRKWENGCKEKSKPSEVEADIEQEISKDEAKDKQKISKPEGNVNDNVNVNGNEECKSESKSKRFIKPTIQEVSDYCQERNNSVKPNAFIDHYESNGWKVGKNPMKDWKATVRKWEGSNGTEAVKDSLARKLNQIAKGDYFQSVTFGNPAKITCLPNMKGKAYSLPTEIKELIKSEFKQPIEII